MVAVDRDERAVNGVGALINDFFGVSATAASFLRPGVRLTLDSVDLDESAGSLCFLLAVMNG